MATVPFVSKTISFFAKVANPVILEDFCEISSPTRFLGIILGPPGSDQTITDMGKALGTLMSDQVMRMNSLNTIINDLRIAHNHQTVLDFPIGVLSLKDRGANNYWNQYLHTTSHDFGSVSLGSQNPFGPTQKPSFIG